MNNFILKFPVNGLSEELIICLFFVCIYIAIKRNKLVGKMLQIFKVDLLL